MGEKVIYLLAVLVFALFMTAVPTQANLGEDVGAWMIKKGIDLSIYSIGDSMVEMGSGNSTVNHTGMPAMIFNAITFTIDPYQHPWVRDWWKTMLVFYVMITILAIAGGGAWALICKIAPDVAYRFAWLTGENPGMFQFKVWMSSVALALIFPYLTLFGVYFILQLNYVVTALMTNTALTAVPPVLDNIIAYICMAIAFLLLTIIMAIRNIIIVMMAAGSLLLAALYLIPHLRGFVTSAFMYFLVIVFMQPLLVFTAAIGVAFVTNLPGQLILFESVIYIGLIILLVVMGVVCLLGISLVKSVIRMRG